MGHYDEAREYDEREKIQKEYAERKKIPKTKTPAPKVIGAEGERFIPYKPKNERKMNEAGEYADDGPVEPYELKNERKAGTTGEREWNKITEVDDKSIPENEYGLDKEYSLYTKGPIELEESLHEEPPFEITDGLERVYSSMTKLVIEKNRRYGNSVMEPLGIFNSFVSENNTESLNGLLIRLDDKLKRIKNSKTIRKNDVSDLLGYLAFLCVEEGWEDFSDLLD